MKKALSVLAGAAGGGAILASILLGGSIPDDAPLQIGDLRIAVRDSACPTEEDAGWDYLNEKCVYHRTVHNWCACATWDDQPLLTEVDPDTIPDGYLRKVAVCETDTGERGVYYTDLAATTPPGWTCVLIVGKSFFRVSNRATKTRLFVKVKEKCCAGCVGECAVRPGSWGICPYCLLDGAGACDSLCEAPE